MRGIENYGFFPLSEKVKSIHLKGARWTDYTLTEPRGFTRILLLPCATACAFEGCSGLPVVVLACRRPTFGERFLT